MRALHVRVPSPAALDPDYREPLRGAPLLIHIHTGAAVGLCGATLQLVAPKGFMRHRITASVDEGQTIDASCLENVRNDHLGSLSVSGVALAKYAGEELLLSAGAPRERRDDPEQHDHHRRPTAEGERFAHREQ